MSVKVRRRAPGFSVAVLSSVLLAGCAVPSAGPVEALTAEEPQPEQAREPVPTRPALQRLVLGDNHGCVLAYDEHVLCWGGRFASRPHARQRVASVVRFDDGLVDIQVSGQSLCAAFDSGAVDCLTAAEDLRRFGTGVYTRLGGLTLSNGSDYPQVCYLSGRQGETARCLDEPGLGWDPVLQLVAGVDELCTLDQGGTVRCWADDDRSDTAVEIGTVPGAAELAVGRGHCVRTRDGALWCDAAPGEAPASEAAFARVTALDGFEVEAIAESSSARCVIGTGGAVRCAGRNGFAQLGVGDSSPHAGWVEVELPGPASEIALSSAQACAIIRDEVLCWGTLAAFSDLEVEASRLELVTNRLMIDDERSCVTRPGGELWCWGSNDLRAAESIGILRATRPTPTRAAAQPLEAFGRASVLAGGQLLVGQALVLAEGQASAAAVAWRRDQVSTYAEYDDHRGVCLVRTAKRELECWSGEGEPSTWVRDSSVPALAGAEAVFANANHVCALVGGRVACHGFDEPRQRWSKVERVSKLTSLVRFPDGYCGLGTNGRVRCFDAWVFERSGFESFVHGNLDVRDVVEVSGGGFGVCARTRGGAIACYDSEDRFFEHYYGSAERTIPVSQVLDSGAVEVDVGSGHLCARIDDDGDGVSEAVSCWGYNARGQLGTSAGNVAASPTPVELGLLHAWRPRG